MSPRTEVFAHIRRALDDLTAAEPDLAPAIRLLMDCRPGTPGAQSFDGPAVSGGSSSSPTERHALNDDRTRATIKDMDDRLRRMKANAESMEADALWFLRFVQTNTSHAPTARDRAEVERTNDPTPECAITRDLLGVHEPAHVTSDCGGVLPDAIPVGRWVYDFVRTKGRPPTTRELERHHKGLIVRVGA